MNSGAHSQTVSAGGERSQALATLLVSPLTVSPREREILVALISALNEALEEGHTGVLLTSLTGALKETPDPGSVRELLLRSGLCEELLGEALGVGLGEEAETSPLVLDGGGRLYFRRYFSDERALARGLVKFLARDEVSSETLGRRKNLVRELLGSEADPHQSAAVLGALGRRLSVITGGPGTGKTRTVATILAGLLRENGGRLPEVLLLAPTGKAAGRMKESLLASMESLSISAHDSARLARGASTIHRALGYSGGAISHFFRGPKNPLAADVVIIDEASMIDVALMKQTVLALRPEARLILLGDVHQLASVDAGSVLREVAMFLDKRGEGALGSYVELKKSFRFRESSSIYKLAAAIREGSSDGVVRLLAEAQDGEVELTPLLGWAFPANFEAAILEGYGPVFQATSPEEALKLLQEFRVLTAHREGRYGVTLMNELIRQHLSNAGYCPPHGEYYVGMPLLVTENDPITRLSNGDVGVVFHDRAGRLSAFFESSSGARRVSLAELPSFVPAFAMTVHKSQGSEYSSIALVLPPKSSPLLTRELFYTAVTRAKKRVAIWSEVDSLRVATEKFTERGSGLFDALTLVSGAMSGKRS